MTTGRANFFVGLFLAAACLAAPLAQAQTYVYLFSSGPYVYQVTPDRFYQIPGYPPSQTTFDYNVYNFSSSNCTLTTTTTDPWLTVVPPATTPLLTNDDTNVQVQVDANALPTVQGLYANQVLIDISGLSSNIFTVTNNVEFRLSDTYLVQSEPYTWSEPPADATRLSTRDFSNTAFALTNINFVYYGIPYTSMWVAKNGMVGFESSVFPTGAHGNLPDTTVGQACLFPYWDNLTATLASTVTVHQTTFDGRAATVITWRNMGSSDDALAAYDFQAVLLDCGADPCSDVVFQYRRTSQALATGGGLDATVGLQSDGGFLAAQYTYNGNWWAFNDLPGFIPGMEADPLVINNTLTFGSDMWLADTQALRFAWSTRTPDAIAPTAVLTPFDIAPDAMVVEVRFSEMVTGLSAADFVIDSSVPGLYVSAIQGGGERFLVTLSGGGAHAYGWVTLQLLPGTVSDLAGNLNADSSISPRIVIPHRTDQIFDNFENGVGLWQISTASSNSQFTEQGWQLGTPYVGAGVGCPAGAAGGANCWGTWLGSPNWVSTQPGLTSPIANGYYPGTNAFAMRAWLQSPLARVQNRATVEFDAFWDLAGTDYALVQAAIEDGVWQTVNTLTGNSGGGWAHQKLRLPAAMDGHTVKVRFYVITSIYNAAPGLYIDNFDLYSLDQPGIYLSELLPAVVNVPTNLAPLSVVIANTAAAVQTNVACTFSPLDTGVTISGGLRVSFGTLQPGEAATQTIFVTTSTNLFAQAQVPISCDAFARGVFVNTSAMPLNLIGAAVQTGTNDLTVLSSLGVVDWLGRRLTGDGSPASAYYQVIDAGTNGVADAPQAGGLPGGDDRVLYSYAENMPLGRFGALNVAANGGLFNRTFLSSLPAGRKVFVRAWDGPTFDQSVAYGDSGLSNITGAAQQSIDFGRWTVNVPTQPGRDWNGDGIPDGWSVLHGMDPRVTAINPPGLQVLSGTSCTRTGYNPLRVQVWSNWVYILYLNTAGNAGVIEVRDLALAGIVQSVTQVTKVTDTLKSVVGMDIDRANGRLLVAEASTAKRIAVYNLSSLGTLSFAMCVTNTLGGMPSDVAVDSTGAVYVADSSANLYRYSPTGVPSPAGALSWPPSATSAALQVLVSIFGDNLYRTYNDSSVQYNLIDRYTLAAAAGPYLYGNAYVATNSGLGDLKGPSKVFEGVSARLYATDTAHNRIQVFSSNGVALAALPTSSVSGGSALGQFSLPKGIWAVATKAGQHTVYVADTGNHRVQRLNVCLDSDGDGMDDIWQELNGVSSGDAAGDPDHDNLTNLGEYRLAQFGLVSDPTNANTTTNFYFYAGGSALPAGTPPAVTNVTADISGSNVTIVAWYDRAPTNDLPVTLSLSGGAYLASGVMTFVPALNACVYTYTIQFGDGGWADARVAGTFQEPMVYHAANLFYIQPAISFTLQALDLALSGFTNQPPILTTNETVTINALFSATVQSATVLLTGPDGATITNDAMVVAGSSASYAYQVPAAPLEGWVTVGVTGLDAASDNASTQGVFAIVWPHFQQMAAPPPTVTWSAVTGLTYQIWARTDLTAGAWALTTTTNLTTGTNAVYCDSAAMSTQCFYQVRVPR